jgi:hypothetical protein
MKRIVALALVLFPAAAAAQPIGAPQSLPLVVDLKTAVVGSWAEYGMTFGENKMKSRWALVARNASSVTLEATMRGGVFARMGDKVTLKLVLEPDPVGMANPVKEMAMQIDDGDPMAGPPDAPAQKFQKPDPKTLVGKETIKVPAGTMKTTHFRDHTPAGTVDVWVNQEVLPLGLVKVVATPEPPTGKAKLPRSPQFSMELAATGAGAKPTVTKPAKPFDLQQMMGAAQGAGEKHK